MSWASLALYKFHVSYRPEIYDAVTPPALEGDVDWYRRRAQDCGGPVLELGAGTGRVTLPIAEAGIRIFALDASEAMLDALRSKLVRQPQQVQDRVIAVQGDMRTFTLSERFALVIALFRAFLHNVTEQDQRACLDRVRQHLQPDGHFAFNVFHPSLEYMAQHVGPLAGVWRWAGTFELPTGGYVMRSEANRTTLSGRLCTRSIATTSTQQTGHSRRPRCTDSSWRTFIRPTFGDCSRKQVSGMSLSAGDSPVVKSRETSTNWSSTHGRSRRPTSKWRRRGQPKLTLNILTEDQ